jgi:hypothetical protein
MLNLVEELVHDPPKHAAVTFAVPRAPPAHCTKWAWVRETMQKLVRIVQSLVSREFHNPELLAR